MEQITNYIMKYEVPNIGIFAVNENLDIYFNGELVDNTVHHIHQTKSKIRVLVVQKREQLRLKHQEQIRLLGELSDNIEQYKVKF